MRLDCRRRLVTIGETTLTLPAMQFFWLYYLATVPGARFPLAELSSLAGGGRPPHFTQKLSESRFRVFPADLQRVFAHVFPMATDKFDPMFRRSCGVHPGLPSTISKINAALRRALGRGAEPYPHSGRPRRWRLSAQRAGCSDRRRGAEARVIVPGNVPGDMSFLERFSAERPVRRSAGCRVVHNGFSIDDYRTGETVLSISRTPESNVTLPAAGHSRRCRAGDQGDVSTKRRAS